MNERHWVESLYDTFVMRDLIGYSVPGSVLTVGLLCELGKIGFLKSVFSNWAGIALLVIASYITATGLRLLGTSLRLVMFHRWWGVFGRGWSTNVSNDWKLKLERFLWRGDELWLREVYFPIAVAERAREINRETLFMHLTGLTGMAILALAGAVYIIPHDGLSKLFSIPECTVVIALVLASLVFLLGHYRHAHQRRVLQQLGNGKPVAPAECQPPLT
jgi:hypothetical protein